MQVDSKYVIGASHAEIGCQDYTLHGTLPSEAPYAIVCDGCSSAPHSDIGARIQALLAFQFLRDNKDLDNEVFANILAERGKLIGLRPECFAATLLTAVKVENGYFVQLFGDGCIFVKGKQSPLAFKSYEFKSGAPNYLIYSSDEKMRKGYCDMYPPEVVVTTTTFYKDGPRTTTETYTGFDETKRFIITYTDNIEYVGLASDGLTSFVDPFNQKADMNEIIQEFTAFPAFGKGFVQRRVNKALKKLKKKELKNLDDVSVGVIYNGEDNESL